MRVRITFSKQGTLRYVGNLDLHKIMERSLRRADLPLAYSHGYHPQPKINLAAALPLGFASRAEVMDVWLNRDVQGIVPSLQANVPPGLIILGATQVDEREPSLQTQVVAAEYQVEITEAGYAAGLNEKIASVMESESIPRERRGKKYDLRPLIEELTLTPDPLSSPQAVSPRRARGPNGGAPLKGEGNPPIFMRLTSREGATGRPEEVLDVLGIPLEDTRIERTNLIFKEREYERRTLQDNEVKVTTYPTADEFNRHFDPKAYLKEMFHAPDDEDQFSMSFIVKALNFLPDRLFIHEFGGGPTLYSVAALAAKAREIHFSDVVDANLREVDAWLKSRLDAHDWNPYIALALGVEGLPITEANINERAALMRKVVKQLMHCDAQRNSPIELEKVQYDLVTAHHCTDVAATTVQEWIGVIQNVTNIVRHGGWLMLSVTTGARTYEVGDVIFECVNLTKDDVRNGLLAAGYRKESIILESYEVEHPQEYSGIIMALACRH